MDDAAALNDLASTAAPTSPAWTRGGARHRRAADAAAARRPLGVRAGGRRHHPGRVRAASFTTSASRRDLELERKIGVYLRRIQGEHGGWPLYHDGALDVVATVKAYFALKMIGDDPAAPHMVRAREALLAHGGAGACNVFTRILLALFGVISWRADAGDAGGDHAAAEVVPDPPRQDLLLGAHGDRAAAGAARAAAAGRATRAASPSTSCSCSRRASITRPGARRAPEGAVGERSSSPWTRCCAWPSRASRRARRSGAIDKAVAFVDERLNGEDGLGAHLPGHGQQRDDVRRARLSAGATRAAPSPAPRSRSCWWSRTTRPTASPASRRCGTPRWSPTPCWKPARRTAEARGGARAGVAEAAAGAGRGGRLGRAAAATCGPAAGPSSTATTTTRTSTTPPWW